MACRGLRVGSWRVGWHPNNPTAWRAGLLGTWDWEWRCYIHDHGWAGGPVHAIRNRDREMGLEHSGWMYTARWAWRWLIDIRRMLEDLVDWVMAANSRQMIQLPKGCHSKMRWPGDSFERGTVMSDSACVVI